MAKIIGLLVVILSVGVGFVLSHGHLISLWQPYEVLIIMGAACGAFLVANPMHVVKDTIRHGKYAFTGSGYNSELFMHLLHLMHDLFKVARKPGGKKALEEHIEDPEQSTLFAKFPNVQGKHALVTFICDYSRLSLVDNLEPHDFDALMDEAIKTASDESEHPGHALHEMAESLPGFGIVAAVLGIVITMGSLDGPAAEIGNHIAAALVGTFMGVLFGYGFVGPIAKAIGYSVSYEVNALKCIKVCLSSYRNGMPPVLAVDAGRGGLFHDIKPTFFEMEKVVNEQSD